MENWVQILWVWQQRGLLIKRQKLALVVHWGAVAASSKSLCFPVMLETSLLCREVKSFTFCKTTILIFSSGLITAAEGFSMLRFLLPLMWCCPMDAEEVWHGSNPCRLSAFCSGSPWHILPHQTWGLGAQPNTKPVSVLPFLRAAR